MPRLSEGDRWQIVALSSRAGWNQKRLAREFGVSQPTISELLSKNRQTGEVQDKPRSGRPVCTDVNDNGLILDYVENDHFATASTIRNELEQQTHRRVSNQTVLNRQWVNERMNVMKQKFNTSKT